MRTGGSAPRWSTSAGGPCPVQYSTGILDEHRATRTAIGVFDVCHMGEIRFRGPRAAEAVQRLVTNDVARLTDGRALYTVACLPSGGIVDDLIVYRIAADHFLIVVNAANRDKDRTWFQAQSGALCDVVDVSDDTGLIAFQGPGAARALAPLTPASLDGLPSFGFVPETRVADRPVSIARTGYTAEDGFEILCAAGMQNRCGTLSSKRRPLPAASRSAWARATRSASRAGSRSTATISTRRPRRSKPGSAGW